MYEERAFTVVDLILGVILVLVALAFAAPFLERFYERMQLQSAVSTLTNSIEFARTEAMQRHDMVALCGSSNGRTCDGKWNVGQIVIDLKSKQVLRQTSVTPERFDLRWSGSLGQNDAVIFTSTGFTNGQQGNFAFTPKQASDNLSAKLVLTRSGRVRQASS